MSKAERYIELVSDENGNLCDQHALRAVEIAREEIYEWLQKRLPSYIAYCNNEGVLKGTELYVNDLKQAMKYET